MGSHNFLIMKFNIVILACFISSLVVADTHLEEKERAGGLLGFGLLGGDDSTTTTATTTIASDTTTTPSTTTTTASSGDSTTTTEGPSPGAIQGLIDLLLGITSTLPIEDIANLMGINTNPIPISDPLGFVTHPLITPIILAAVTLNIPALALAQGALAGNLIITHLLTQQAQG